MGHHLPITQGHLIFVLIGHGDSQRKSSGWCLSNSQPACTEVSWYRTVKCDSVGCGQLAKSGVGVEKSLFCRKLSEFVGDKNVSRSETSLILCESSKKEFFNQGSVRKGSPRRNMIRLPSWSWSGTEQLRIVEAELKPCAAQVRLRVLCATAGSRPHASHAHVAKNPRRDRVSLPCAGRLALRNHRTARNVSVLECPRQTNMRSKASGSGGSL
jgi:hypothetical protein